MSEMVEHVARAMCRVDGFDPEEKAMRDRYLPLAHAAIAAMHEPTGNMIDAGAGSYKMDGIRVSVDGQPSAAWRAMIDAALKGK